MTEEQKQRIHSILYSTDSREELAERIVALEELVAEMYENISSDDKTFRDLREYEERADESRNIQTYDDTLGTYDCADKYEDRMKELGIEGEE